jgi:hypothetical protein
MIKSDDAVLNYQLEGACPSAFPSEHFETGDIKAGRMAGVEVRNLSNSQVASRS